jgi:hypothetical protein
MSTIDCLILLYRSQDNPPRHCVTAQQKYTSSRHISPSCHPHFSLFASSLLFSLYLTLLPCFLTFATSCNNFSCFAIIRCLITTAQLPRHAAISCLVLLLPRHLVCFVLLCRRSLSFHPILPYHSLRGRFNSAGSARHSFGYIPLTVCFAPVVVLTLT